MKFEAIRDQVAGVPYMTPEQGRTLYDFILDHRPAACLELGFAHGVSSCYTAAALDEIGAGHLTTVDLASVRLQPSIEDLLAKTGLERYVTIAREATSYTWFLKKKIEERTSDGVCTPLYDFCFIDGAKNWTIDGLAFFLVDKLLNEGGWILFDDLGWAYATNVRPGETVSDGITIRNLGKDERTVPHLEAIFRLLVMQHPSYSEFRIQDEWWGWAHKVQSDRKVLRWEETASLTTKAVRAVRRLTKS
jgi:predicted O-methyltransferase YrrM